MRDIALRVFRGGCSWVRANSGGSGRRGCVSLFRPSGGDTGRAWEVSVLLPYPSRLVIAGYCFAVRVGGGGSWRTCAMRYDEPRLVWTRLTTTHL